MRYLRVFYRGTLNYLKGIWNYLDRLWTEFTNDNCFVMAGGIAYFTMFSLVPILLVIVGVLSFLLGQHEVKQEIFNLVESYIGKESAYQVMTLIERADLPTQGIKTTVLGLITLIFTSSTLFIQLKSSLNLIWGVKRKIEGGPLKSLKDRGVSFLMVLLVGLLIIISIALESTATALRDVLPENMPMTWFWGAGLVENLILFILLVFLFGLIFKVLPDVDIKWKDVRFGAFLTAALFMVGRLAVSLYLGSSDMTAVFGPSSAIIIILFWVYYSGLILFLGAEIIEMHAHDKGRRIQLAKSLRKEREIEEEEEKRGRA